MMYDSSDDTHAHINTVKIFLSMILRNIEIRMEDHDASKLREPEKETYDRFTPLLKELTYGSAEYRQCLKDMGPALEHHYANNTHHPEHFKDGIKGMSLLDVIEMLADWKAASMRHADGNILKSLEINQERFQIDDQLMRTIQNTILEMEW